MTEQKAVVEAYTEGFRTGDLAKIVSCLFVSDFHDADVNARNVCICLNTLPRDGTRHGDPRTSRTLSSAIKSGTSIVGSSSTQAGSASGSNSVPGPSRSFRAGL